MLFQEMVARPVPVKPTVVVPPSEDYDLVYDLPLLALADATDQLGEEEPQLPLIHRTVDTASSLAQPSLAHELPLAEVGV